MKKGFTYFELLIVLSLILIIGSIIIGVLRVPEYFKRARDLQRLNDLQVLASLIQNYINSTSTPDLDGPYLDFRGIDEVWPTIFISVPLEDPNISTTTFICNNQVFAIYRSNKNNFRKLDGTGWLPINFVGSLTALPISSLPVDPINVYTNSTSTSFYYAYAFRRKPAQFELSAYFESKDFQYGGKNDKVSTDNGSDPYRYEIGTNLNILP
ncbi:MAG: hypothetical protein C4278_02415 [Patescibacteria group bacterium]